MVDCIRCFPDVSEDFHVSPRNNFFILLFCLTSCFISQSVSSNESQHCCFQHFPSAAAAADLKPQIYKCRSETIETDNWPMIRDVWLLTPQTNGYRSVVTVVSELCNFYCVQSFQLQHHFLLIWCKKHRKWLKRNK